MTQELTNDLWQELRSINRSVNRDIRYVVDAKLYEKVDYWTVVEGKGKGDCDDYALTKIKRLINETGWDRENLSIAICYTEENEGHAVCIARTDRGDFVLDNRHRDVKGYDELPYTWVMMEDYANKCWVKINS